MARTIRNAKLDSRSARTKLAEKKAAYWAALAPGCAIGYRKGRKGGVWIAKLVRPGFRREATIGPADDAFDADGTTALSFAQAQERARSWLTRQAREAAGEPEAGIGPYTVADALADYERDYSRRGGKALDRLRQTTRAHVLPELGKVEVGRLTRRRIENWLDRLAGAPPRLRTRRGVPQQYRDLDTGGEAQRRRRATANRVLTVLKAALNLAIRNHRVVGAEAWQAVKPYREVNAPKVRYLTDAEARRLVNACPPDFRQMVVAALLTGARYGELAAMKVGDVSHDAAAVHIPRSKSGKSRHVFLSEEGKAFFEGAAAGKSPGDLLFPRSDGKPWGQAHQFRPIRAACHAARIQPAISFHVLRHTYASRLAMRGTPMGVIAAQLGHADTRMTERHYAHLAPSYVADAVRTGFPSLGILKETNVVVFQGTPLTAEGEST
jgi:integrase